MPRFVICCLLFCIAFNLHAAPPPAKRIAVSLHEYYIVISGIDSRQKVKLLQAEIQKKPGVKYFMASRYPARYFLLKSETVIPIGTFLRWAGLPAGNILLYGEGNAAKEAAIVYFNKQKR